MTMKFDSSRSDVAFKPESTQTARTSALRLQTHLPSINKDTRRMIYRISDIPRAAAWRDAMFLAISKYCCGTLRTRFAGKSNDSLPLSLTATPPAAAIKLRPAQRQHNVAMKVVADNRYGDNAATHFIASSRATPNSELDIRVLINPTCRSILQHFPASRGKPNRNA